MEIDRGEEEMMSLRVDDVALGFRDSFGLLMSSLITHAIAMKCRNHFHLDVSQASQISIYKIHFNIHSV